MKWKICATTGKQGKQSKQSKQGQTRINLIESDPDFSDYQV